MFGWSITKQAIVGLTGAMKEVSAFTERDNVSFPTLGVGAVSEAADGCPGMDWSALVSSW